MPTITGKEAYLRHLKSIRDNTQTLVGKAMFVGASIIATEAKRLITNGSISGKKHVPSKPHQPPNADTRLLDQSIRPNKISETKFEVEALAPYAGALEFGTKRMIERPYLRPATKVKREEVIDLVKRAANKANRSK
jgi:HK97 gp10 family phage protein